MILKFTWKNEWIEKSRQMEETGKEEEGNTPCIIVLSP